ncbi:prion-inhibition and propagation-domain-containing protein [Elsinoe ampelina]|uniref:Prion-inhibition and propagation-domain-containing protein n=1 Tax=Elsinoe ampelina TaxID=302913 RepID=A0A6A6G7C0_9PEZI|nr:prion-inhibition and propagation-domain-containing protein [Elsinoe ampelina]
MPADVFSIVALSLTCLHGCVKGLVILGKARHYQRDVSDINFQTSLALHLLTTWAQEAGLTEDPPTLLVSAKNASLVPGILAQLETLLTDLSELKLRYGIDLQATDDTVEQIDQDSLIEPRSSEPERKWSERLDVSVFLKRTQPWKRLKWVTLDEEKFEKLLAKVKGYISDLRSLLEDARQRRMERMLEACLRSTVIGARADHRLIAISKGCQDTSSSAISAAARMKRSRLRLGLDDPPKEHVQSGRRSPLSEVDSVISQDDTLIDRASKDAPADSLRLSMRLLTLSRAARSEAYRTLAEYAGRSVLLEWKYVADLDDRVMSERVNDIASFLRDIEPTLHSLQCRGYVVDQIGKRYGYVFDLPESLNAPRLRALSYDRSTYATQPVLQLRSLQQMFSQLPTPSLNTRLSLALTLLETLLDLHTAGWLHKGIHSGNILLLRRQKRSDQVQIGNLSEWTTYIGGYTYSRLDNPWEMTEPMPSEIDSDLYRHPRLLSTVHHPFQKSFDVYSVGCTLLEIGLWQPLRQALMHHSTARSDVRPISIPKRHFSEPSIHHIDTIQENDRDGAVAQSAKHDLDLIELKHRLLGGTSVRPSLAPVQELAYASADISARSNELIASLEAAMGNRYTHVVDSFIMAGQSVGSNDADEHERMLDLEMMARDTVRAMTRAI